MSSNDNSANTTSPTTKSIGTGATIPRTEAALSPRLLEILQYRESMRERTPSNATILTNDRRTAASGHSERPTSAPAYQTPKQHLIDGIMERFGPLDQVRQGPSPPPFPDSTTASAAGSEPRHPSEMTLHNRTNPGHGPKSVDGTLGPSESRLAIPKILVQADPSAASNRSSFTIVDGPENQRPIPPDLGTNRRASDTDDRGTGDARNGRGASNSRNNRGDGDTRKSNDAKKRGSQQPGQLGQQPGRPPRLARTHSHDPPEFSPEKTDPNPATLNPSPLGIEATPSRGSSIRKKGEQIILMATACTLPCFKNCRGLSGGTIR